MKKISFNLNDIVRFKLTDKGCEYVLKLNRTHPVYLRAPLKYTPDANGWIETELWDFANIFGPTMGMGFDQTVEVTIEMYVPENEQFKKETLTPSKETSLRLAYKRIDILEAAHRKIVAESHDSRAVDYAERALIDAKSN